LVEYKWGGLVKRKTFAGKEFKKTPKKKNAGRLSRELLKRHTGGKSMYKTGNDKEGFQWGSLQDKKGRCTRVKRSGIEGGGRGKGNGQM